MGAIQQIMAALSGASGPVQGQYLLTDASTELWTVPAGVTSVSIVCVQEGQGRGAGGTHSVCEVLAPDYSTVLVRAQNGARIGDGGGDGGAGGAYTSASYAAGAGGAGGYAGNGGAGSATGAGSAGSGGAAGGGGSKTGSGLLWGGGGGGVGVLGQGSNGTGGAATGVGGGGGSGGQDGAADGAYSGATYGGGQPGVTWSANSIADKGGNGGALAYKNAIAVTPGTSLLLRPYGTGSASGCQNAAIRIIWGAGRAFPSTNTGDV